jgi:hypothetical protein
MEAGGSRESLWCGERLNSTNARDLVLRLDVNQLHILVGVKVAEATL